METLIINLLLGILAVFITLENLLVCVLVARYKSLQTFTNGFVVSLALVDFLHGCVVLPMFIGKAPGLVLSYMVTTVLLANISTMMALTFDRYLAVLHHLAYQSFMEKHFYKIIIVSWVLPIGISLIPLCYSSNFTLKEHKIFVYFIVIVGVVVPYMFIMVAYVLIFRRVGELVKYLARQTNSTDEQAKQEGKRVTAEAYVARIFIIIAIVFIITWMPIIYMTVVNNMERWELMPHPLSTVSWFTLSLGAMINAPLYAFIKKDFNTLLKNILLCGTRGQSLDLPLEEPTGQHTLLDN